MKQFVLCLCFLFSIRAYCQELSTIKIYHYKKEGSLSSIYTTAKVSSLDSENMSNNELWDYFSKHKNFTFPSGSKPIYFLNRNDTTKIANIVSENIITKCWENGNIKSFFIYRGAGKKWLDVLEYHENSMLKMSGRYFKEKKKGKWKYYDEEGKKYKKEKYDATGNLKKSKELSHPRITLKTVFQKQNSSGTSYVIQY
jgi:antitoxin component YwqK of YwqJK toxin-antitoxin module